MNTNLLACSLVATALLGGPALALTPTATPFSTAKISKVVRIPGMDKAPVPLKKICPAYPYDMRREGIQGIVTVDMLVDSTGRVIGTELVSSTEPELSSLVLAAAKEWTFIPASAKGKPITTRVRVPFEFSMPKLMAASSR